jgi:hypothetical protein
MMARIRSFFMEGDGSPSRTGGVRSRSDPDDREAQTVNRSRAPVSDEGWRSLDMARASI